MREAASTPTAPAKPDELAAVRALIEAGDHAEAEKQARALLGRIESRDGPDSLAAADCLEELVEALRRAGKTADPDARRLAERALATREKVLGPEHPDVAKSLNNLAAFLTDTGDYAGARPLFERALAIREKQLSPDDPDVANSLNNLAALLYAMGDYAAVRPLFERAVAIDEKVLGTEHPSVASDLDNLAVLLMTMGDYAGARPLLERALAIREKTLGPMHRDVATSLSNLASLLNTKGDYAGARPLYERALAIDEQVLGPEHPDLAISLNNLAGLLQTTGDHAGARPRFERALAITEKALGPEHPDVARSLGRLAQLLQEMGDYASARPLFERALAIYEKALGPDHSRVATALNNLAVLLKDLGDYARARPLYERALAIHEKSLGPDHSFVAANLSNLGALLQSMGDYIGARPLYERSLVITEKALGPEHENVAASLNQLAGLLQETGDFAGARPLFERALAIDEKALGPEHSVVAMDRASLARLRIDMGDYAEAQSLYESALATLEKALGPRHPNVARSQSKLAGLLQLLGEYARAQSLYERAAANLEAAQGPEHPDVATNLSALASLHCATGDVAPALEAALRAEQIGRDHALLTFRALSERQALQLASVRATGLNVALSLASAGLPSADRARAWDAAVRSRALVLDEIGARHRSAEGSTALAPAAQALTSASQRLANLTVRGLGQASPEQYRKLLDGASQDKEQAERALAEQSASFREEQARAQIGLAEVARALHSGEALVAYRRYARHDVGGKATPNAAAQPGGSKTVPSYLAFVLQGGKQEPAALSLGSADDVDALVKAWRQETARPLDASGALNDTAQRAAGEKLRRATWDPLVPELKDARRVYIVPDGALHVVSFAALPVGADQYLVESGPTLHYLSAERDLVPPTSAPHRGEGLFAIGGAAYDDPTLFAALAHPAPTTKLAAVTPTQPTGHQAPLAQAASDAATTLLTKVAAMLFRGETSHCPGFTSMKPFENLPGAAAEAEEVAALWKAQSPHAGPATEVTRLSGAAASEAALKTGAAGRRVLHLATHGFFLGGECEAALDAARGVKGFSDASATPPPLTGENPLLLSGLVLAGANHRSAVGPGEEDGILTAEEIASLDLSGVEWAVLSACGSGLGDIKAGEGVLGLERAFRVAGAQTVIMSLWDVDDAATREWMKSLYEARLVKKLDTADCVREASLAMLKDRRAKGLSAHPFYWGAFVAAGDSR